MVNWFGSGVQPEAHAGVLICGSPCASSAEAAASASSHRTVERSFPARSRGPTARWVKALARAWRWQKLLDAGIYTSVSEIGEAEGISKSYISRVLRLALLAPDVVEAVLGGRAGDPFILENLERPLPASWEAQCD
jgi:hypothetical protein